jgi:hypothetical protein
VTEPAEDFLTNLGYVKPQSFEESLRAFMGERDVIVTSEIMEFCGFTTPRQMENVTPIIESLGYVRAQLKDESGKVNSVIKKIKNFSVVLSKIMQRDFVPTSEIMTACGFTGAVQMSQISSLLESLGYEKIRIRNQAGYQKKRDFLDIVSKLINNRDFVASSEIAQKCGFDSINQMNRLTPIFKKLGYKKIRTKGVYGYTKEQTKKKARTK